MKPMRPGVSLPRLDTYSGAIPQGWLWQAKLNDERGVVSPEGGLFNRLGRPFAPHKVKAFAPVLWELRKQLAGEWLDVALLGFRGGFPVGSIVVLDLPDRPGGFEERVATTKMGEIFLPEEGESAPVGQVLCLDYYTDAKFLFAKTLGRTGLEGVIGRRPGVRYTEGDSRDMCKSKWRM